MAKPGERVPPGKRSLRSRLVDALCVILHRTGLLLLGATIVRWFGGGGPRVLCYHRIAPSGRPEDLDPERFAAHLEHLRRRYRFVHATDLVLKLRTGEELPRRGIVLTFDDGYADLVEHAVPPLRRAGALATFFVTTAHLPGSGTWAMREDGPALLDKAGLTTLVRVGYEIGSHSRTHPLLTGIAPDEARREVLESRDEIEAVIGSAPVLFAYPWGRVNEDVAAVVDEAGYSGAFTTGGGKVRKETDPIRIPRIHVPSHAGVSRLACEAAGLLPLLRRRR